MTEAKKPIGHDKSLDQFLKQVAMSDVDLTRAERLGRLERNWSAINKRRMRLQRVFASLALVMGWLVSNVFFSRVPSGNLPMEKLAIDTTVVGSDEQRSDEALATSPYHELVRTAGIRYFATRATSPSKKSDKELLDDLLTEHATRSSDVNGDLEIDYDQLEKLLQENLQAVEPALIQFIQMNDGVTQSIAARLLGRVATSASVPFLLELQSHPDFHEMAVRKLAEIADPPLIFELANSEIDLQLQGELVTSLFRNDAEALVLLLRLVDDPRMMKTVLSCVANVDDPPSALLIRFLTAPDRTTRLAAALVLGRLDDDQLAEHLIRMAIDIQTRYPAMVALVASDNDSAKQFVQASRQSSRLIDSVQTAQTLVDSISHVF